MSSSWDFDKFYNELFDIEKNNTAKKKLKKPDPFLLDTKRKIKLKAQSKNKKNLENELLDWDKKNKNDDEA